MVCIRQARLRLETDSIGMVITGDGTGLTEELGEIIDDVRSSPPTSTGDLEALQEKGRGLEQQARAVDLRTLDQRTGPGIDLTFGPCRGSPVTWSLGWQRHETDVESVRHGPMVRLTDVARLGVGTYAPQRTFGGRDWHLATGIADRTVVHVDITRGDTRAVDLSVKTERTFLTQVTLGGVGLQIGPGYGFRSLLFADPGALHGSRPDWEITLGLELAVGRAAPTNLHHADTALDWHEWGTHVGGLLVGQLHLSDVAQTMALAPDLPEVVHGVVGISTGLILGAPMNAHHEALFRRSRTDDAETKRWAAVGAETALAAAGVVRLLATDDPLDRIAARAHTLTASWSAADGLLRTSSRWYERRAPFFRALSSGLLCSLAGRADREDRMPLSYMCGFFIDEALLKPIGKHLLGVVTPEEPTLW